MSTDLQAAGLLSFIAELDEEIALGAGLTAVDVGDLARQLAPEDSGDLKASGTVVDGDRAGQFQVRFGDDLPDERAAAQEFGTVFQDPQPYIEPAVEAIDPAFRVRERLADLARRSRV